MRSQANRLAALGVLCLLLGSATRADAGGPDQRVTPKLEQRDRQQATWRRMLRWGQERAFPARAQRSRMIHRVLERPSMDAYIQKYADEKKLNANEVRAEAERHLDRIAARYSPRFIKLASPIAKFMISRAYRDVRANTEHLQGIVEKADGIPLVFLPPHRSNVDSPAMNNKILETVGAAPHMVGGAHLFGQGFGLYGWALRSMGTLLIKRSREKGDELFWHCVEEYLHENLGGGINFGLFTGATRSKSGKPYEPRAGVLAMIVKAVASDEVEDIGVVPTHIGYDRGVIEQKAYYPSRLKSILGKAAHLLKAPQGTVAIDFRRMVKVSELAKRYKETKDRSFVLSTATDAQIAEFSGWMAQTVQAGIDARAELSPHALVASALLNTGKALARAEIEQRAGDYQALVTDQVHDSEKIGAALDYLVKKNLAKKIEEKGEGETRYTVAAKARPYLEFHRNNAGPTLAPYAYVAATILKAVGQGDTFRAERLTRGFKTLRKLFKKEFILDPSTSSIDYVDGVLAGLVKNGLLKLAGSTYAVSDKAQLQRLAAFLEPFHEAYGQVLALTAKNPPTDPNDLKGSKNRKRFTGYVRQLLDDAGRSGQQRLPPGVTFHNALRLYLGQGVLENATARQQMTDALQSTRVDR